MSVQTSTPQTSITALPVLECTTHSPLLPLSSTPFASSPLAERFEYPFPVTQPLLSITPALIVALSSSTQTLLNGSIVPPTGTGRGMGMSSFASFSAPIPTAALPYPSATASASQALAQTLPGNALPADAADVDNHHCRAAVRSGERELPNAAELGAQAARVTFERGAIKAEKLYRLLYRL